METLTTILNSKKLLKLVSLYKIIIQSPNHWLPESWNLLKETSMTHSGRLESLKFLTGDYPELKFCHILREFFKEFSNTSTKLRMILGYEILGFNTARVT